MARKNIGIVGIIVTFGVACYAVYLSLDPEKYFYYTAEQRELWTFDPVEVAVFSFSIIASGLVAFGALLSRRPRWLWQRAALALILLAPWGFFSTWAVIHAPAFIILHALWILGLTLVVLISGLVSLVNLVFRKYEIRSHNAA